jgi:hypothetical protein
VSEDNVLMWSWCSNFREVLMLSLYCVVWYLVVLLVLLPERCYWFVVLRGVVDISY